MTEIKYEQREGTGKGKEYRVAASQYIHRFGGKFVYLSNGDVTLCASDSTVVLGWAVPPKDTAPYDSWKSSSTGRADKIFVITALDDVFEMPYDQSATTLTASYIGEEATIAESGSTYDLIQEARVGSALAADLLTIVDVDTINGTVLVKMKPSKKQAA